MKINQHFNNLVTEAAKKGTDASSLIAQRDQLFKEKVVPALQQRKANATDIENARKKWVAQTDTVMREAGLLSKPKAAKPKVNSRRAEKDKRAEDAIQESVRTGSKLPIIKETVKSTAETIGNAFGQGVGAMIESGAGWVRDIGENEKDSVAARVANYGKNLRQGYEESASTLQTEMQQGKHGKAPQLGVAAVQSVPAMVMPFGAAKTTATVVSKIPAIAKAAQIAGMGAGVVAGHTQNYGEVRRNATQNLERDFPSWEKLQGNPLFESNVTKNMNAGMGIEQARVQARADVLDVLSEGAADQYGTAMTALEFIAPSGAVLGSGIMKNAPTSKVGKFLTGTGADAKLVQRQMNDVPRVGLAKLVPDTSLVANKAAAKMVGKQALEEGVQGAIGEYGGQAASANIGGTPVDYGKVGQSFIDEALVGGVMGGGMQSISGGSPTAEAKNVANQLRNQTNRLRQEEAAARKELSDAIQLGNQDAINSAQENLSNIGIEADKVKKSYDQYGIQVPFFVENFAKQYQQQAQQTPPTQPQQAAQAQQQPQAAPTAPTVPVSQPQQAAKQPGQYNPGMASTTNKVMQAASNGAITMNQAQAIQSNPVHSQVFDLATSGDKMSAHGAVMSAVSQGAIDMNQAQQLILAIDQYAALGPSLNKPAQQQKPTLSGIVNSHVQQQIQQQPEQGIVQGPELQPQAAPIDAAPELTDFGYTPNQIEASDPTTMELKNGFDFGTTPSGRNESLAAWTKADDKQRREFAKQAGIDEDGINEILIKNKANWNKIKPEVQTSLAVAMGTPLPVQEPAAEKGGKSVTEPPVDSDQAFDDLLNAVPPIGQKKTPAAKAKPTPEPTPEPQFKPIQAESEFVNDIRYAHLNNPGKKAALIEQEIRKGRPRHEVLKQVNEIVSGLDQANKPPESTETPAPEAKPEQKSNEADQVDQAKQEPVTESKPDEKPEIKQEEQKSSKNGISEKAPEPAPESKSEAPAEPVKSEMLPGDIGKKSDNQPFLNRNAANLVLKNKNLADSYEVVEVAPSKFVLRLKDQAEPLNNALVQKYGKDSVSRDGNSFTISGDPEATITIKEDLAYLSISGETLQHGYNPTTADQAVSYFDQYIKSAQSQNALKAAKQRAEEAEKLQAEKPAVEPVQKPKSGLDIDELKRLQQEVENLFNNQSAEETKPEPTQPAKQDSNGPLLGADGQPKWFSTRDKAEAHLSKKDLGDQYQIKEVDGRFELHPVDTAQAKRLQPGDQGYTYAMAKEDLQELLNKRANMRIGDANLDDQISQFERLTEELRQQEKSSSKKPESTAAKKPGSKTELVRTYLTKSGKIGAEIKKLTSADGRISYSYRGEWGAGSVDPKTMQALEDDWKQEKRGFTIQEGTTTTEVTANESNNVANNASTTESVTPSSTRASTTPEQTATPGKRDGSVDSGSNPADTANQDNVAGTGDAAASRSKRSNDNAPTTSRGTDADLKPGNIITFSQNFDYASPGEQYTIDKVTKEQVTVIGESGGRLSLPTKTLSIEKGKNPDLYSVSEPKNTTEAIKQDVEKAIDQANVPQNNFEITDQSGVGEGTLTQKFNTNIEVIRLINKLDVEQRQATPQERELLARYVGWGGLSQAFPRPDGSYAEGWQERGELLKSLLRPDDYDNAKSSTSSAFYTPVGVVRSMWKAVEKLGYQGGLVLESSVGTGNFIGLAPKDLANRFIGTEFDGVTSRIAQHLYPQEKIFHSGYEKLPINDGMFDLAIGNPPYGARKLTFKDKPHLNGWTIHNQFMLSTIENLKPEGISVQIVSHSFMDAAERTTRNEIAKIANLVGAVRLPPSTFKDSANTEVITDILIFQKRPQHEIKAIEEEGFRDFGGVPDWVDSDTLLAPDGDFVQFNPYFKGAGRTIGTLDMKTNQYGAYDYTLNFKGDAQAEIDKFVSSLKPIVRQRDLKTVQQQAAKEYEQTLSHILVSMSGLEIGAVSRDDKGQLFRIIEQETELGYINKTQPITPDTVWSSSYNIDKDGNYYKLEPKKDANGKPVKAKDANGKDTKRNVYERVIVPESEISAQSKLGEKGFKVLSKLTDLRDTLREQLNLELNDSPNIEKHRKKLRSMYDEFVASHGYINSEYVAKLADEMPDAALMFALESGYKRPIKGPVIGKKSGKNVYGDPVQKESASPADILSKRVVFNKKKADHAESASDGVSLSLAYTGKVDLKLVAELTGKSVEQIIDEMHNQPEKPLIYQDPELNQWVTAQKYLSGNVRKKIRAAQAAGLTRNVEELEKVIPEEVQLENITFTLGMHWIPTSVYKSFVTHITDDANARVYFEPTLGNFEVKASPSQSKAAVFGSPKASPEWIVERILNNRSIRLMKTVYVNNESKQVLDLEATEQAIAMADTIKMEFSDWVYGQQEIAATLKDLFNEKYNNIVREKYDGSHLQFVGKVPDNLIELRTHQVNAVWRGITNNFVLYDHAVGSGKTFTGIARAMERKRLGLSKKPVIVVPNHMVEQFAADVYRLYPAAKVLAAGKKDFERKNRKRLFAKIATGDYDIIVVPHSSFSFVKLSSETEARYLQKELDDIMEAISEAKAAKGTDKRQTVKQLEDTKARIQGRLESKLNTKRRDRDLSFEQMGIDDITIDEAHEFKNLFYHSNLSNVVGMGTPTGSGKSLDLFNKFRYLHEMGGSGAFMTGTPISNSAVEMHTMMRYLMPDTLKSYGLERFDNWAKLYADNTTKFEATESGQLKQVTRFARDWKNMRSLMDLWYSVVDPVTNEDVKADYLARKGEEFPLPEVEGGTRQSIVVEPTESQKELLEEVLQGFNDLDSIQDYKERNAERLRLMDRARKVSLDARAIDSKRYSDEKGGKLEAVANKAFDVYKQWDADKGTQIIFLDRSVPKSKGDDKILKEYDEIMAKLEKAEQNGDVDTIGELQDKLEKFDINEVQELRAAATSTWNAYDEIKNQLIAKGIPANEIRFVQEAANDQQKQDLFNQVKSGEVRIIIGSTPRMGAGTNIQDRLVHLHHVDVTWKPSDIEQREGRIIRQGNKLYEKYKKEGKPFKVGITAYVTERTTDAKLWDVNSAKLKTINGIRHYNGDFNMDFGQDADNVSMQEIAALASGNPLMLERVTLDAEIQQINRMKQAHNRKIAGLQNQVSQAKRVVKDTPAQLASYGETIDLVAENVKQAVGKFDKQSINIDGQTFKNRRDAEEYIDEKFNQAREATEEGKKVSVSYKVNGQDIGSMTKTREAVKISFAMQTPMMLEYNGKSYDSSLEFASEVFTGSTPSWIQDPQGKEIFKVFGLPVEIDKRFGEIRLTALTSDGRYPVGDSDISGDVTATKLSNAISTLASSIRLNARPEKIEMIKYRIKSAEQTIKELEPLMNEPFTKENELAEKQARLAEVVSILSDGKESKENSEGESDVKFSRQDNQTETQAFKRWFGDSKVVNADGTPKIVYHGTNQTFNVFNVSDIGIHAGTIDQANSRKSEKSSGEFKVMPLYMRINNPLRLKDSPSWKDPAFYIQKTGIAQYLSASLVKRITGFYDELKGIDLKTAKGQEQALDLAMGINRLVVKELKAQGYDGVVYKNTHDGTSLSNKMKEEDSYIVFDPEQIKSATQNNGEFDPNNPDIRFSGGKTPAKTGTTTAQVRAKLVNRFGEDVVSQLERDGKLEILDSHSEAGAEGFYHNGKVTLIADALTDSSIVPTFLHELGGHAGFQGVLSENAYNNLMRDFNRLVAQKDPIALEAKRLAERESDSQVQQDEYLPYLITVAAKVQNQGPAIKRLINRVLSAVKAWAVDKLGLNLKLNANDILALSERMIQQVARNDGGGNREFTRSDFQRLARIARTMPDGSGSELASSTGGTSIERAILTRTFLQAKSRESRELLLARFSNVGSQRLTDGNAVLYSRKDIFEKVGQVALGRMALLKAEQSKTLSKRTLKLFNTMLHKALTDETGEFKKTFDLVQDKINHVTFESSLAMDQAPDILTQLETWESYKTEAKNVAGQISGVVTGKKTKHNADIEKVGNLMFENTLSDTAKVHTDAELRALGFDKDQIDLYRQARNAIDTSLDTFAKTTVSKIYKHFGASSDEVLALMGRDLPLMAHVNEIKNLIEDQRKADPSLDEAAALAQQGIDDVVDKLDMLKSTGYVPLMRFGKYFVRVHNPATGDVAYRQHFESEAKRNLFYRNYDQGKIQPGYELESSQVNELEYKLFQGVSPETVALFAEEAGIPLDNAEAAYIKHSLRNNHALKRLLKRQGIDGFDTDFKRVLASFVLSNSRYASNQLYNPAIDESIQDISTPEYQEDAVRLRDYSLDTQEELSAIKNFSFVWYMGYSFMFGLVNITQPFLQTMPFLMQYSKDWKVTGRSMLKAVESWRKGTTKIDPKYKKHYERARREGHLDPQNTWMLQGLERGKSGIAASGWQLFSHAAGFFAQASETVNRRTSLFAALDVAESLGQAKLQQLGFKDAYDFAVRTIQETQGIYNKGNRPRVARGNIGSILMMYKQFMIAYIEQMVRMQKSGLWGGEDDDFKKRMAALVGFGVSRTVLVALGMLMAASGATGLPFMRDILDVVETAGGLVGKPFNTEREIQIALQDALGDTIGSAANTALMDGIVNLQPVMDVKGRMGMGDLIPASAYFSPLANDRQKSSELTQIAGALGGLVGKVTEAVELAQVGAYGLAGVQLAPKAATSLLQGGIAATTGDYRNMKTGVKTNDATVLDGVLKMLDAQPASIAKEGRIRGLEMKDKSAADYVNARWRERYEQALASGDRQQVLAVKKQIIEYNQREPRYPITFNQKTTEKNFNKSNIRWQDKRQNKKGLDWMDNYNPYLEK